MKKEIMIENIKSQANKWLSTNYDIETKEQVKELLKPENEKELIESFYKELEFGTGGLRGIMGVGTNRMNIYTVGMATQGFSNYIKNQFSDTKQIKMAIAYDCRNNSRLFAETIANIFSANGFYVYLFEDLRPTPELSFAIRHYRCQGGVVITASHNPKEYNGFKAYWDDGAQLIAPHDKNVITEVRKITEINQIKSEAIKENIEIIGAKIDEIYLNKIKTLSLSPEIISKHNDIKIVYTPIHGTGVNLVPAILKKFGFKNVFTVEEQDKVDGNFPTVISPNPENAEALKMALKKAKSIDAEIVMATDPDADRVGIAVKDNHNEFVLLNGNQTGALLVYYFINKWKEKGFLKGKEYIVKTIVSSDLISKIAEKDSVEYYDVLTGFKYIAEIIRDNEGKKKFIVGGEESYGYLAGEFVRDKDAVMACALIAEVAAWAKSKGKSMFDLLIDIYIEYGFYYEKLENIVKKGKEGAEEIEEMMTNFRENPPKEINGSQVILIKDYESCISNDLQKGKSEKINLPKSNVLQFYLEDGSKISVRPSGTEPKIKFYFSVNSKLKSKSDFEIVKNQLDDKINNILKYFS
ncbi:MAG: phospho-sugar mutase [Bacteroidales bacterium]|nr:phospho-sugar mutase [Bacteroidales bacterium]MBN2755994.1 phospho-sugar mutase [Bacteroidales bacterium]